MPRNHRNPLETCAASQVAVRAGHISPPHCTASGNGLQSAIAGARGSFTVQARDAHTNALSVGGAEIVVLLRGADGQQVSALVTGACIAGTHRWPRAAPPRVS